MREEPLSGLSPVHSNNMHLKSREAPTSEKDLVERAVSYLEKLYKRGIRPSRVPRTPTSNPSSTGNSALVIDEEPQKNTTSFFDLPPDIQIHIFSYLDVISLCRASKCCITFCAVANDELLWEKKLKKDSRTWDVVDHKSHPTVYKEVKTDLSAKEIYLQCCPECRKYRRGSNLQFNLPKLSFYLGLSVPRIVIFGPGLETSSLIKNLLWDARSPFTVKGMFPGQFEGVGSGVCLQFDSGQLNLITLYASTRREREYAAHHGLERKSKLLVRQQDVDIEANVEDEEDVITLTQPVRELCTTVDAFVYVVDSTRNEGRVTHGLNEFHAMMKNRWLQPKAPLLVLSCVADATVKAVASVTVADTLELCDLSRPWQVRSCHVSSLYGCLPGITWLLQEVMHS